MSIERWRLQVHSWCLVGATALSAVAFAQDDGSFIPNTDRESLMRGKWCSFRHADVYAPTGVHHGHTGAEPALAGIYAFVAPEYCGAYVLDNIEIRTDNAQHTATFDLHMCISEEWKVSWGQPVPA